MTASSGRDSASQSRLWMRGLQEVLKKEVIEKDGDDQDAMGIREALRHEKTLSFDQFLQYVLHDQSSSKDHDTSSALRAVAETLAFKECIALYVLSLEKQESIGTGRNDSGAFARLVDCALNMLYKAEFLPHPSVSSDIAAFYDVDGAPAGLSRVSCSANAGEEAPITLANRGNGTSTGAKETGSSSVLQHSAHSQKRPRSESATIHTIHSPKRYKHSPESDDSRAPSTTKIDIATGTPFDENAQSKCCARLVDAMNGGRDEDAGSWKVRCAKQALDCFSRGTWRKFVIGVVVEDNQLRIVYYDRSIIVNSELINFAHETERFLSMLFVLDSLRGSDRLIPSQKSPYIMPFGTTLTHTYHVKAEEYGSVTTSPLSIGLTLQLGREIFREKRLFGAGTIVLRASVGEPPADCSSEVRALYDAWRMERIFVKLSARLHHGKHSNGTFFEKPEGDDRLPRVLHIETLNSSPPQDSYLLLGDKYSKRVWTIEVIGESRPIYELKDTSDVAKTLRDIFYCYETSYKNTQSPHRDICPANIKYRSKNDGVVQGLLLDLDSASTKPPCAGKFTAWYQLGTSPFMAREMSLPLSWKRGRKFKYMYRHDLESMFYVMIWLACFSERLRTWIAAEDHFQNFLLTMGPRVAYHLTKWGEPFARWMAKLEIAFSHAFLSPYIEDARFDEETIKGKINFEIFGRIMELPLVLDGQAQSDGMAVGSGS